MFWLQRPTHKSLCVHHINHLPLHFGSQLPSTLSVSCVMWYAKNHFKALSNDSSHMGVLRTKRTLQLSKYKWYVSDTSYVTWRWNQCSQEVMKLFGRGRSSMKIHHTRASSCVDKLGYSNNAEICSHFAYISVRLFLFCLQMWIISPTYGDKTDFDLLWFTLIDNTGWLSYTFKELEGGSRDKTDFDWQKRMTVG